MSNKVTALIAKRDAAQALVNKYNEEIAALNKFGNIVIGGTVSFDFGRGDKKVQLTGEVVATGTLDNGVAVLSVLIGKGTINADIKRIPTSTVTDYQAPTEGSFAAVDEAEAVAPVDPLSCTVTSAPVEQTDPLAGTNHEANVDALLA